MVHPIAPVSTSHALTLKAITERFTHVVQLCDYKEATPMKNEIALLNYQLLVDMTSLENRIIFGYLALSSMSLYPVLIFALNYFRCQPSLFTRTIRLIH